MGNRPMKISYGPAMQMLKVVGTDFAKINKPIQTTLILI
jgi:hypothetical protein